MLLRHYYKMQFLVVVVILLLYNVAVSSSCPVSCNCENVEVLQCRNAEFSTVPEDLDAGADAVTLDLSFNSISTINNNAFEKIPTLKTLIITDNNIETIEADALKHLEYLETVDLHNNAIVTVHSTLFQDNSNLNSLDLSNNRIENFKLHLDSDLKVLNLSGNKLNFEGISSFAELAALESLDLSRNQIETLNSEVFSTMENLTHLDFSGNLLEYDCSLSNLRTLCTNGKIVCVTDDEQSWEMLGNLNCDEVIDETTTTHAEDFLNVEITSVESEVTGDNAEEGSGGEPVPAAEVTDPSVDENTEGTEILEEGNWIMIAIIACSVCVALLVIIIAAVCFLKHRKSRVDAAGSLSHAHSIEYLNQEDEFNPSYKRSDSARRTDANKVRNNNYDRVVAPPNYSMGDQGRDVIQLGENAAAEIVRVPSFKTHGIATPLNLPEEVCPVGKDLVIKNRGASPLSIHSLPRSSPTSSYDSNSLRIGSLRKNAKSEQVAVPDIQLGVPPVRRTPSNKRR